jgi:hypothetical protein
VFAELVTQQGVCRRDVGGQKYWLLAACFKMLEAESYYPKKFKDVCLVLVCF